jgi:hypothetical protein
MDFKSDFDVDQPIDLLILYSNKLESPMSKVPGNWNYTYSVVSTLEAGRSV